MSRLIDADQFVEDESEAYLSAQNKIEDKKLRELNLVVHRKIQMLIADAPTVDAVPVVRCENCVCYKVSDEEHAYCSNHLRETEADDFCSYGIRKDWEDESD